MLSIQEKIDFLEIELNKPEENYADSFKTDIIETLDNFDSHNPLLHRFLKITNSFDEIENWISKLTSRIVMKEDQIAVKEIIMDYLELG